MKEVGHYGREVSLVYKLYYQLSNYKYFSIAASAVLNIFWLHTVNSFQQIE